MREPFRSNGAGTFWRACATRSLRPTLACAVLAVLTAVSACSHRPNVFGESREMRLLRLDQERGNLARTSDPVDRTRIQIRISDLMISFMGDAAADGDMELVEARVAEYRTAILDARKTMMDSGRDATRNIAGYQDLEIALRQQIRQLDDIGNSLTVARREPIENLIVEMTEIRDELLDALFPESDPA